MSFEFKMSFQVVKLVSFIRLNDSIIIITFVALFAFFPWRCNESLERFT